MRLHSAMGLFLGHKTLTGSAQTGYELTLVRVGIGYVLTWVRVDWHPSYGWMHTVYAFLCMILACTVFNMEGKKQHKVEFRAC